MIVSCYPRWVPASHAPSTHELQELVEMEARQIIFSEEFRVSDWRLGCSSRAVAANRNHQAMFQVRTTASFARFLLVTNYESELSQQRDSSGALSLDWLMSREFEQHSGSR